MGEVAMGSRVTVLGSANLDHVLAVPRFPRPGETLTGHNYSLSYGGKGANQALALVRTRPQGLPLEQPVSGHFIGAIGDDTGGQSMLRELVKAGVLAEGVVSQPGLTTGAAFIHVDADGENFITLVPGANDTLTRLNAVQRTLVDQSDWLLLQQEVPASINLEAARRVKDRGGQVVLNPAPVRDIEAALWHLVDVLTPNQSELASLAGVTLDSEETLTAACSVLHNRGVPLILVTLGAAGVWLSQAGEPGRRLEGFRVTPVDTTGAGDTFNGALVAALASGLALEAAIMRGQAAAALQVTRPGAQPAVPTGQDVDDLLAA